MSGGVISYTVQRGDEALELEVEYEVAPLISATYDDPEEGGEIETMTIVHGGQPFVLTDEETDALEAHIYETHDYSDVGYQGPEDW